LLWIPFFGWGLALMSLIAIDRANVRAALRDIARRGKERLAQGFWVVIFPEGTRVPPGERREYQVIAFIEDPDGYKIEFIERKK
jgi:1-acyl-sn-glycerol-3-phosphate acyltransferase